MTCPYCHCTLYSRRPRCEDCGESLPEEYTIPHPQAEAMRAAVEESKAYLAKRRAEAAMEEEERRAAQAAFFPPPGF